MYSHEQEIIKIENNCRKLDKIGIVAIVIILYKSCGELIYDSFDAKRREQGSRGDNEMFIIDHNLANVSSDETHVS